MDDLNRRWTRYHGSLMFHKVDDGDQRICNQDWKRSSRKTPIIWEPPCTDIVVRTAYKKSTYKISLLLLLTKTAVLDIGCNILAHTTRTTCPCSSVSTANALVSVTLVVFVFVCFSSDPSCTIGINTGCHLYGTIFSSRNDSLYKLDDEWCSK